MILRIGMKVSLEVNEEEGWGTEYGTILSISEETDTVIVQLDPEFFVNQPEYDDGIREVELDQITGYPG